MSDTPFTQDINIIQISASDDEQDEVKAKRRWNDQLKTMIDALRLWRHAHWWRNYKDCAWGEEALMSDKIVKTLASRTGIKTLEDLKQLVPDWTLADALGQDVLDIIQINDQTWADIDQEKKARKRQRSAENQTARLDAWNVRRRKSTQSNAFQMYNGETNTFAPSSVSNSSAPAALTSFTQPYVRYSVVQEPMSQSYMYTEWQS